MSGSSILATVASAATVGSDPCATDADSSMTSITTTSRWRMLAAKPQSAWATGCCGKYRCAGSAAFMDEAASPPATSDRMTTTREPIATMDSPSSPHTAAECCRPSSRPNECAQAGWRGESAAAAMQDNPGNAHSSRPRIALLAAVLASNRVEHPRHTDPELDAQTALLTQSPRKRHLGPWYARVCPHVGG